MLKSNDLRKATRESDLERPHKIGRGAVRTRGFISVGTPSKTGGDGHIRSRGAMHTRGTAIGTAKVIKSWQILECCDLNWLIEELRDAQDHFPLTVVVENPQRPGGSAFLDCLCTSELLIGDDTLWVLGDGDYTEVVPKPLQHYIKKYEYLNVKREGEQTGAFVNKQDGARADILLPDLVFISDTDAGNLKERLKRWEGSAWAMVLDGPDDFDPSALNLGIEEKPDWLRRWVWQ